MNTDACGVGDMNISQITECYFEALLVEGKQQVSLFLLPSIHQISTLEKTKFYQRSILSSLMSTRIQRVSPFSDAAESTSSEILDFHIWFSPGFLMQ